MAQAPKTGGPTINTQPAIMKPTEEPPAYTQQQAQVRLPMTLLKFFLVLRFRENSEVLVRPLYRTGFIFRRRTEKKGLNHSILDLCTYSPACGHLILKCVYRTSREEQLSC